MSKSTVSVYAFIAVVIVNWISCDIIIQFKEFEEFEQCNDNTFRFICIARMLDYDRYRGYVR